MKVLQSSESPMSAAVSTLPLCAVSRESVRSADADDRQYGWILRLMRAEGAGILRMLQRLLGCEADVLDAYQDCFCKLAGLGGSEGLANARAYAYRTATNIAIEFLRSRRRHEAHHGGIAELHAQRASLESERTQPAEGVAELREAIGQLPAHLRSVVVLRDLGALPYEEVGRILEIDPATARVYRRHAVVKLADLLGSGVEP